MPCTGGASLRLKTSVYAKPAGPGLSSVPIHRQPAYHDAALSFPHTEQACAEVLSLPLHPGLSDDDVARVIREVVGWAG